MGNTGRISLLSLVYKLQSANLQGAENAFDARGRHFGGWLPLITNAPDDNW